MASPNEEYSNGGHFVSGCKWVKAILAHKLWSKIIEVPKEAKKLASDDPRRITHSLKVGLALTLVSLFYYFKPLYDGLGVNAIWAVLTVVVVFEFSVGGTLGKGVNRMIATMVAGALGVGTHHLATLSGRRGEPVLLAISVFIIAAMVTFMRFFPSLKAKCDYGLSIFILTFALVSVSGYRDDLVLKMAHMRLSTIIIGSCTAIVVCICVFPVWIGQDLHNLVLDNIDKLASFLEGFGSEYFKVPGVGLNSDKSFLESYKSALTCKGNEENMANLAGWEPGHGQFGYWYPWKQYLKIGNLTRDCAYKIEALHNCLNSNIQSPVEVGSKFQESCITMSMECGKALKELSTATRELRTTEKHSGHIATARTASENIKFLLKIKESSIWEEPKSLMEFVPVASMALLLIDVTDSIEKIVEAVQELASLAHFSGVNSIASPKPEQPPQDVLRGMAQPLPLTV